MLIYKILKGWIDYLYKPINLRKLQACLLCDDIKYGKHLKFVKDDIKEVKGAYCGVCKCPLSAKLRTDSECPKNYF